MCWEFYSTCPYNNITQEILQPKIVHTPKGLYTMFTISIKRKYRFLIMWIISHLRQSNKRRLLLVNDFLRTIFKKTVQFLTKCQSNLIEFLKVAQCFPQELETGTVISLDRGIFWLRWGHFLPGTSKITSLNNKTPFLKQFQTFIQTTVCNYKMYNTLKEWVSPEQCCFDSLISGCLYFCLSQKALSRERSPKSICFQRLSFIL